MILFLADHIDQLVIDYNRNHWPTDLIRMHRTTRREGLIRAKIIGSHLATAPILVFLDSHCEVNIDWLQPLVSRIAENPHTYV